MMGRSHGIHAEPITFGLKMLSFYFEFKRNLKRLESAIDEISICAISGPVGTYNSIDPSVEQYVASKLNLKTIEVPIRYADRKYGETQISRFKHGFLLLKMVLFAYKKLKIIKH